MKSHQGSLKTVFWHGLCHGCVNTELQCHSGFISINLTSYKLWKPTPGQVGATGKLRSRQILNLLFIFSLSVIILPSLQQRQNLWCAPIGWASKSAFPHFHTLHRHAVAFQFLTTWIPGYEGRQKMESVAKERKKTFWCRLLSVQTKFFYQCIIMLSQKPEA